MRKLGKFFHVVGVLLMLAALCLSIYNIRDDNRAKQVSRRTVEKLLEEQAGIEKYDAQVLSEQKLPEGTEITGNQEEQIPDHILNPKMEMPVKKVEGQGYIGILSLNDLSIQLPVMGDWDYPKLKEAPCRYAGSAYEDDLVIMAHNYQSHFGKIRELGYGSRISFTDMDENVFCYQVVTTEVLNPTDVDSVVSSDWDLTLFTCTTGGQYRIVVRCMRA